MVAKTINEQLINQVNLEPITSLVQDTVGFLNKKKFKLSEIVDMFLKTAVEDGTSEWDGNISLHIRENTEHDWVEVFLDVEEGVSEQDCALRFLISTTRNNIFLFQFRDHWSKRGEMTPARLTRLSGLEAKIFRLYSAQVEIEVDDLEFETYWSKED